MIFFYFYIHPEELTVSETTQPASIASYLDLLFTRDKIENVTTKLYNELDALWFPHCELSFHILRLSPEGESHIV